MSKDITEWIKYELYPTLFECIDVALPEFNFKRFSGGWRSSLKIDKTRPKQKRTDKTVVTKKAIGRLFEQGGENLSLVDYVMRRDGVEFIDAVEKLASLAGLELPTDPKFNKEDYQSFKDKASILEECNSYFIYCLEKSKGAEKERDYLKGRGYSDDDIKNMELGYIPNQLQLVKHLNNKGFNLTLVDEVVKLNKNIGITHKLTIAYRSGGSVKGFKFRTVGDDTPKYLNSTGLDRLGGFFNLSGVKGDKDVVIVEGELDSLSATARGVENVVATGGDSISSQQVRDAIKRGAKSFTICFDTDPGKEEETANRINSAIQVIRKEKVNKVYVVNLPALGGGKTDPDRLIKESGIEAFREALRGALPYYEYRLQDILNKYGKIEEERGGTGLTSKDIDKLLEEVVETATGISEPIDRDRCIKLFTSLEAIKALGISEESLSITVDRLTYTRDKEAQSKEFKKLLLEANQLQDKGEIDKALDILDTRVKQIKITGAKDLLPPPQSFNSLLEEIATLPPAYKTGYSSLDSFIGFTPGSISLIAGRPSHGKTTFMFNLLLQMGNLYPDDTFYLFSYEEPVKNISVKLLNRLANTDLSGYYRDVKELSKPTNYEFIKHYIKAGRTDIAPLEEGKRLLRELIDSQRIKIVGRNYSVEELSSLIAYLHSRERIGAVIIDYIQRMRTERRTQDKRTEIAHISDSVLQIAKETGLPIILGAQLNRDAKNKPTLENLKEAGNLEEDANTVISVYCRAREEEDNINGEINSKRREVELEIKTLKNREGEVNTSKEVFWDRWTGVIKDPTVKSYF